MWADRAPRVEVNFGGRLCLRAGPEEPTPDSA